MSPLANSYLTPAQSHQMEPFYPLRVYVCSGCLLVQTEEFESPDSIFGDYAYFASYSDTWLQHAKTYADMAIQRFRLNRNSLVVEIASNDGYLLQLLSRPGNTCSRRRAGSQRRGRSPEERHSDDGKILQEDTARDLVAKA